MFRKIVKLSVIFIITAALLMSVRSVVRAQRVVPDAQNIAYAVRTGSNPNRTSLDIYNPAGLKNAPVMIMIHGGGWRMGDKANRGVNANKVPFFKDNGFVYVSINYRLSPEVQHPGHIEDVAEAVSWVSDNIGKYGGDGKRIFVMGHSAGAHLAALVATDDRRLKTHKKDLSLIKGVILLDGAGYDVATQMKGTRIFGGILNEMYVGAFTSDPAVQRDASPLFHISAGKNVPPFLIFTAGSRRDSVNQSTKMVEAMKNAGINAETIDDPTKSHGSINTDFGLAGELTTNKSKEFLDRILRK